MRVATSAAQMKLMSRGAFDRQVTILAPAPAGTDEWNEATDEPPVELVIWAKIATSPGIERFSSGEQAALSPMQFFFHWRPELVKPVYSILYDGKTFDVKSVEELGRRQRLRVIAVARAD